MAKRHSVVQGECISSLGLEYGFFPDTLWEHADNAELRSRRSDPNTLKEGDAVSIPDKREKKVQCATGRRHVFRRKGVPEKLKIQFMRNGQPRANARFQLVVDGVTTTGSTTGDGKIDQWIDPAAKEARIKFLDSGSEYDLLLGHLDPIEEMSGVQGRLANLGFYSGPIDGQPSEATKAAIKAFQSAHDIHSPELDPRTRDALEEAYREAR